MPDKNRLSDTGANVLQKLEQLKIEFLKGQEQLSGCEKRRQELYDTLLRISGAIQVLEELLNEERDADNEVMPKVNGVVAESAAH